MLSSTTVLFPYKSPVSQDNPSRTEFLISRTRCQRIFITHRTMSSQARIANDGLDLTGKTAAIAGGSQGIGAGVAIRFAQAGANVIIIGRSKERLEKVIAEARKVAKSAKQKFEYVSVDLSLVSGVKAAAKEIEAKSNGKIDYLVQTQGGMPNGIYETTTEGIESHFAVQVLGRFALSFILASSGVLKETAISILQPGGSQTTFDLEDVELTGTKNANRFHSMGKHVARDGLITDAYTKALQSKFLTISFFHLAPGLVQTDVMVNQGVPFPFKQIMTHVVFPIAARTFGNTVASYADIPVFLAANDANKEVIGKEGYFLGERNTKASLSPYSLDENNQTAVLERLKSYL